MSGSNLDPHDRMRARDVSKVARGEQAARPAHEYGTVSPPPPQASKYPHAPPASKSKSSNNDGNNKAEKGNDKVETSKMEAADSWLPFTTHARHCYTSYLEYHKCLKEKGKNAAECDKFAKYYRSICPSEWIDRWNKERELGTFPGAAAI